MNPDNQNRSSVAYTCNVNVIYRQIGDELVIINLSTDRMFSLNQTGARFWELLISGMNIDDISQKLLGEFDIQEEGLKREISTMLSTFEQEKLIDVL